MKWDFEITDTATRDFDRLDARVSKRVREKLLWFIENFELTNHLPLTGTFQGSFKLRVGDWRVVYEVNNENKTVYIIKIEHRSKVYKARR